MSGRHARRRNDPPPVPPFGTAGTPEGVAAFDGNVSRHAVVAADKRLHGEMPYDQESGSKPPIDRQTGKRKEQ